MTAILVIMTTKYSILFNQVFTNNVIQQLSIIICYRILTQFSIILQLFIKFSANLVHTNHFAN